MNHAGRSRRWHLATVTISFCPAAACQGSPASLRAGDVADALMEYPGIAGVRVQVDRRPSVYRIDVHATTDDEVVAQALHPAHLIAVKLGADIEVLSITVARALHLERAAGHPPRWFAGHPIDVHAEQRREV
jgi:hypothetical protein